MQQQISLKDQAAAVRQIIRQYFEFDGGKQLHVPRELPFMKEVIGDILTLCDMVSNTVIDIDQVEIVRQRLHYHFNQFCDEKQWNASETLPFIEEFLNEVWKLIYMCKAQDPSIAHRILTRSEVKEGARRLVSMYTPDDHPTLWRASVLQIFSNMISAPWLCEYQKDDNGDCFSLPILNEDTTKADHPALAFLQFFLEKLIMAAHITIVDANTIDYSLTYKYTLSDASCKPVLHVHRALWRYFVKEESLNRVM